VRGQAHAELPVGVLLAAPPHHQPVPETIRMLIRIAWSILLIMMIIDNLEGHYALKHRRGASLQTSKALYTAPFLVFLPHPSLCRLVFTRPTFPVSAGLWINTRGHPDSNRGPPDWEAEALTTTPPIGALEYSVIPLYLWPSLAAPAHIIIGMCG
jgi:hypothetical protein